MHALNDDHLLRLRDLIEQSAADIHRFVAHRVPERQDAADIAQEALLRGCLKLHTVRGENVRPWLFTIAHNLITDHYRAQNRFEMVDVSEMRLAEKEPELQTPSEGIQTICASRERMRCWVECITRQLPLEEQVAVLLADLQGYRDKDSATVMNMTEPSFKMLLHQARERLRKASDGNCTLVAQGNGNGANGHRAASGTNGHAKINGKHNGALPCQAAAPAVVQQSIPDQKASQPDPGGAPRKCGCLTLPANGHHHHNRCLRLPKLGALRDRLLCGLITDSLFDLGETVEALTDWLEMLM